MLLYLSGHSRPDIQFAVSQCARFSNNPKASHERALMRLVAYLKKTRTKGLILRATAADLSKLQVDCYVDADFAGLWGSEDRQDPTCVKSRTGFVIFVANCPVLWISRLQTDIATSTMEAEYNALSMAMRDLLPLRQLLQEICTHLKIPVGQSNFMQTFVHEDNSGCLALAKLEPGRMTPRSKHYGVKYHWFRSHLQPNKIEIVKVESALQRADFLTKSLARDHFAQNRRLTSGW